MDINKKNFDPEEEKRNVHDDKIVYFEKEPSATQNEVTKQPNRILRALMGIIAGLIAAVLTWAAGVGAAYALTYLFFGDQSGVGTVLFITVILAGIGMVFTSIPSGIAIGLVVYRKGFRGLNPSKKGITSIAQGIKKAFLSVINFLKNFDFQDFKKRVDKRVLYSLLGIIAFILLLRLPDMLAMGRELMEETAELFVGVESSAEGIEEVTTQSKASPEEVHSQGNSQPFSDISVAGWDIEVLEILRGEEAWAMVEAADTSNVSAPKGMEYLLVYVHIQSEQKTTEYFQFDVVGDKRVLYEDFYVSGIELLIGSKLAPQEELEGWLTYFVEKDEKNLMLVFGRLDTPIDFIAIDEGAHLEPPAGLAELTPGKTGRDRNDPIPFGEKAILADWEITFLEMLRGEEAWSVIQAENPNNTPPKTGMEYILAKVKVRNINPAEGISIIDSYDFHQSTGSENILYADYLRAVIPDPLDAKLLSGGETEGWIILEAAENETDLIAVFAGWHFSLEP